MEVEQKTPLIQRQRNTILGKVTLYGEHVEGRRTFDHRQEAEPMGHYLSQMRVESLNFWWLRTDSQNVALQGLGIRYKKLNEEGFFDSYVAADEKITEMDKDYETLYLDNGEYIRGINVTTASANGKIGALEFISTYNGRATKSFGVGISRLDDKSNEALPPGETKKHNFLEAEAPGYVVGFFGQYDEAHITHLGVYIAPYTEINYYARRPFVFLYKKLQQDKGLVNQIATRLGAERDGERFKDANLENKDNNSSRILFYFMESALRHPELFKNVLEYL